MSFKVKFWGVRGSIPCPTARHIAFGGNTSCVELSLGGKKIVFDARSGIRQCGHYLLKNNVEHTHLLLTHTHWDHINGFPFFVPAYRPDRAMTIMAGHAQAVGGVRNVLAGPMAAPNFPVPLEAMRASIAFEDFDAGDSFNLGPDIVVRTSKLNHPNSATGYRVEYRGKSVCYITDTEHVPGQPDQRVLGLIEGADLMIYDSTYTDAEFPTKVGWGHSTWQEGVRLARAANVKQLAIFHHDPDHEDPFMERIEAEARALWMGAFCARESTRVNLI